MSSYPDWLESLRVGGSTIQGEDLTKFLPPEDANPREGAVLMLFGEGAEGPDVLLTERSHTMRSQPGQISFPGGGIEPDDDDAIAAALREAKEEVDLEPHRVEVLATLPRLWLPPSNYAVTPVMAWSSDEIPVRAVDPNEVHTVFRSPIAQLLDPEYRVTVTHPLGYSSPGFLVGPDHSLLLWGFTAGILNKLFDYVGMTQPWDESREHQLPDSMLRGGPPAAMRVEGP